MNANVEQGTVKELLTLFAHEWAATCEATLLLLPTVFSPRWSERLGALRPLVGSKGAFGKGVLTIKSFAYMAIRTLTHEPVTGTIIPGSTILNGAEGTLRWDVRRG